MAAMDRAKEVLRNYWGYDSFRPGQEHLIRALLDGRDVLGIMPTGAGKSICYEVPALLFRGSTIVISPLISLMEDQVNGLRKKGIDAAAVNSLHPLRELTGREPIGRELIDRELNGWNLTGRGSAPKILYVSPERLKSPAFLRYIRTVDVSFVCVDEAHCISKWGHDFRPDYLEILAFIRMLPKRPPVAAFTATADSGIRREILDALDLQNPYCLSTGFDRPNLFFAVEHPKDKLKALLHHVRRHPGECGIIYCNTRRTTGHLVKYLVRNGIIAEAYHAGLPEQVRSSVQERFLNGSLPLIVATNAFGMGVDKPDVRYVIHFNMPKDMESYYQEAGRAGRDGFPAECILLYGSNDIRAGHFFIDRTAQNTSAADPAHIRSEREKLRTMVYYAAGRACLRAFMLEYFGEHAPSYCGKCSVCLSEKIPVSPELQKEIGIYKKSRKGSDPITELLTKKGSDPITKMLTKREQELYDQLIALRHRIGKEKRISPEKIFPDRILRAFVSALPRTKFDMLFIDGISFLHVFRYGTPFLEEIRTHVYFYKL